MESRRLLDHTIHKDHHHCIS